MYKVKRPYKSRLLALWKDVSGVICAISESGHPYIVCTVEQWKMGNQKSSLRVKWTGDYKIFPRGKQFYSDIPQSFLIDRMNSLPRFLTIPTELKSFLKEPYIKEAEIPNGLLDWFNNDESDPDNPLTYHVKCDNSISVFLVDSDEEFEELKKKFDNYKEYWVPKFER